MPERRILAVRLGQLVVQGGNQRPCRGEIRDVGHRGRVRHARMIYYMLRDGVEFHDLGAQYFVQRDRDKERLTKRLLRRLRELGVDVEVKEKAA